MITVQQAAILSDELTRLDANLKSGWIGAAAENLQHIAVVAQDVQPIGWQELVIWLIDRLPDPTYRNQILGLIPDLAHLIPTPPTPNAEHKPS